MTPPKLTIPLLMGIMRAHSVIQLRFYDSFNIFRFFVVYICSFLMQILKHSAKLETMTKKSFCFGRYLIFLDCTTYQTIQSWGGPLCKLGQPTLQSIQTSSRQ